MNQAEIRTQNKSLTAKIAFRRFELLKLFEERGRLRQEECKHPKLGLHRCPDCGKAND